MTAHPDAAEGATAAALEILARAIAKAQHEVRRASGAGKSRATLPSFGVALERVYRHLTTKTIDDANVQGPAEWFLDNYYLVRRVARQVTQDLPSGFAQRLPILTTGHDAGLPRIEVMARELIAKKGIELDRATLDGFIAAYQKEVPLSIAELWALPTMLRAAVLSNLLVFLAELKVPGDAPGNVSELPDRGLDNRLNLDPSLGVERSVRELRLLAEIDWQVFFEEHSCVEAVLLGDPANVYSKMDFDTSDDYRKAVEDLAWNTRTTEEIVAGQAVLLARSAADDPRRGHAGYYLVGEGRRGLEAKIGFRPRGLERVRRLVTHFSTIAYLLPLTVLTVAPLLVVWWYAGYAAHAVWSPLTRVVLVAACILAVPPIWSVGSMIMQRVFAKLLPPRRLPKLDYSAGVPDDSRTLVVIPTLLTRAEDVQGMLQQLELHYLSNPDPMLGFALLTDYLDSTEPQEESELLDSAADGIGLLNARHGDGETGPFLLLHRQSRWNPAEARFMGWERKRGKLEELNRLLRGDMNTSFVHRVGDPSRLQGVRFVITLDNDTELPLGCAQRLIGLLAHPLNQATFDPENGRVLSGYTVVQPRLETSPRSLLSTRFARIFAGSTGLDIYTHASSELYQDLFGSGIYCGKGIYDVDAFTRSLKGRIPENTLLSHDLLEGVHGRTALASDVVVYEQYPENYGTYSRRLHRWVRGDWQLVPWLLLQVPSFTGSRLRNRLTPIDRWKILDNLRRSIVGPCLCLVLVAGWTLLPYSPLLTTFLALLALEAPLIPALTEPRGFRRALARCALAIVFLLHEASVVVDAVVRVFFRTRISRKHMLQWTPYASSALSFSSRSPRLALWLEMLWSPLLAVGIAAVVAWLRPTALFCAAPILIAWTLAPEIARWISLPRESQPASLDPQEEKSLRLLARRTWLFFETFVGPSDQWLPIDNYQESPLEQTAHRTSPTNIGLMLISTLSAYDFGYLGPRELTLRLRRSFDSIGRLTHYRGHLLNWYETRNLEPLLPRYVSTVDSGNFAGCLLALKKGCHDAAQASVIPIYIWQSLGDSLALVEESLTTLDRQVEGSMIDAEGKAASTALRSALAGIHRQIGYSQETSIAPAYARIVALCGDTSTCLKPALLTLLQTGIYRHEAELLHSLRTAMQGFEEHLHQVQREIDSVLPWLRLAREPAGRELVFDSHLRLDEVADAALTLDSALRKWESEQRRLGNLDDETESSVARLREAFAAGRENATALRSELLSLATCAEREAYGMDFRLLFDARRKLFHIGYNVTADQADSNHYDLLASEARLASYFAIIKRDVPQSHWYALGRPMRRTGESQTLLSWGGTMFEYLMPSLLMRSRQGTLLQQSTESAVTTNVEYGSQKKVPWGISESGYARLDAHETYQYRSFGVPGLGFRRDLADDLVVAPYASLLALSIQPRAVVENLSTLHSMGLDGTYGLFEAIDFNTDTELETGRRPYTLVRSYMAHHQGMVLVALNNYLHSQIMVERFHAEPAVSAGEMLLNERAPTTTPAEWPLVSTADHDSDRHSATSLSSYPPWSPDAQGKPQAFVLGNDRLSTIVTDRGGGGLRWRGLALTRYQPDPTCDGDGIWFYVHDKDREMTWLATSQQGSTTYTAHSAEFHQRNNGISVHLEISVAPDSDVELRRITLHNESDTPRNLSLTSAGEPLLLQAADAAKHPAFARLFIESEYLAEMDALVFTRRPRLEGEGRVVLVHRLVMDSQTVTFGGYQTDRSDFFGRCGDVRAPRWLADRLRAAHGRSGMVIDPIMTLTATVILAPRQSVAMAFVTSVAHSRSAAIATAARYGTMHAVRWAFRDAKKQSPGRLSRAGVDPDLLPSIQRLTSALLFADPSFRTDPHAEPHTERLLPCKNALWGQEISGDLPIVLIRVGDPDAQLINEIILAQRYLRSHSVRFDLVIIAAEPSGYSQDGLGNLHNALAQAAISEWMKKPGGVYLLEADQLDDATSLRLAETARIILDTRDGSLAEQLGRHVLRPPPLPRFEASLVEETAVPPTPVPSTLLFDNGTGGFSQDGREYLISIRPGRPTPAPWCNVLANPDFGCIVSESSLGSTWSENAGENRLTPWRNDPVFDTPSEVLYLRDEDTAEVWSTTPLPAGGDAATTVHHGAGYTTYVRTCHGLEQEFTVFVPANSPLKIARLRLKNTLARQRRLTLTYYVEWVLGSLREEQVTYIEQDIDRASACLFARCAWNPEFAERVAFLAAANDLHGFTTDRTEFLGVSGNYTQPDALTRWGLSDNITGAGDPCGALQTHHELGPSGEEHDQIETHFILGQAASRDGAAELVERFRQPDAVDSAWDELGEFWDRLLGGIRVKTPEPAMDLMLNRWLLYQSLSSRIFGRTGFYQSSGAFGFRDQLQDVLALLNTAPERARAHILEAAAHQFEEGDVLHWWHPPSGRGVRTRCSDDMAWLPYVVACYVTATGDAAIMSEPVPFLKAIPLSEDEPDRYAEFPQSREVESLLEHCRRALERALTSGAHGLPLMAGGDWNDGMNRVGEQGLGESVWLGWFLCDTMNRFAVLCEDIGASSEDAATWRARAETLRAAIEACAWDGAWYARAFHDDGSVVGSHTERECKIDSIAQSWSVLSNMADEERAKLAMQAAEEQLVNDSDRLALLLRPPFDVTSHDPGYIRSYPPGVRENGGQYTHAATWLGWAYAALGDGENAARIFRIINPILRTREVTGANRYRAEPYVLAGDVYSVAPWVGRGGWSWYTGAAAWTYRLGTEAILGLQMKGGQLCINPCIPPEWKGFEAWIRVDGGEIHIVVENPDGVSHGIASITLDGTPLESNGINTDFRSSSNRPHEVRVTLG